MHHIESRLGAVWRCMVASKLVPGSIAVSGRLMPEAMQAEAFADTGVVSGARRCTNNGTT